MKHKTTADLPIRASALLDQQYWCWGQDISFPKGNILTNLGFSRYRSISKTKAVCTRRKRQPSHQFGCGAMGALGPWRGMDLFHQTARL